MKTEPSDAGMARADAQNAATIAEEVGSSKGDMKQDVAAEPVENGSTLVKVEASIYNDAEQPTVSASVDDATAEHLPTGSGPSTGTVKLEDSGPIKMEVDRVASNVLPSNDPVKSEEAASDDNETDEEEEEEYCGDDPRGDILELLQEVESSGSFACWGKGNPEMCMPGLKINGIEHTIGLPLSPDIAKKISSCCEQAPFGRGDKTVVDTSVRQTKQLDPSKFQITNPRWKAHLNTIVSTVRDELGVMPNVTVEAQLYKLLLYEPGSFFSPHRDSEKAEGMFATLVVILPTKYSGGELIVEHNGESKKIDQSSLSEFSAQYAAFYADCMHELKKLESGYRLCIVYNLVKVGFGPRPSVSQNDDIIKSLKLAAKAWAQDFDGNKLVIMTDHLYTPAGMKSRAGAAKFKGKDAVITSLLETAAEAGLDLEWDHGVVQFHESGCAECDYYSRYGGGSYSWGETTESEMTLTLDSYGTISIDQEEEMVPPDFYDNKDPEEENFEPTGNAGVQAERQYSDEDAIVVWPKSRGWEVISDGNVSKMISYYSKNAHTHDSSWNMEKLDILSKKIIGGAGTRDGTIYSISRHSPFVEFITIFNTHTTKEMRAFAKDFVRKYIQAVSFENRIPTEISPAFGDIMNIYSGDYDQLVKDLLVCFSSEAYRKAPDQVVSFVKAFHVSSFSRDEKLSMRVVSKAVQCMELKVANTVTAALSGTSVKTCLALFLEAKSADEWVDTVVSFIKNVTKESCQNVQRKYGYSASSVQKGLGPVSLCNAGVNSCCEKYGWKTLEDAVIDSVQKMVQMGSLSSALALVRELKGNQVLPFDNDRAVVCSKLANIVVQEGLKFSQAPTVASLKNLFLVLPVNSSSMTATFVENVLKLDIHKLCIPFVTSVAVGKISHTSAIGQIAMHCAKRLAKTAYVPLQKVQIWPIKLRTHVPSEVEGFLRSPCKIEYDYQLAKAQHKTFLQSLAPYIASGEIRAVSHQPRNYWHVRITKMKGTLVDPRSVGPCSCRHSSYRSATGTCVYQSTKAKIDKINDDLRLLNSILALLPDSVALEIKSKKRKALQPAGQSAGQPPQKKQEVIVID